MAGVFVESNWLQTPLHMVHIRGDDAPCQCGLEGLSGDGFFYLIKYKIDKMIV